MGGDSQTTESTSKQRTKINPKLRRAGEGVLAAALQSASMPYAPNRGVTIAAFSPQEKAAFRGANVAASAFGLPTAGLMDLGPTQKASAGGIRGYSTGDIYDRMVGRSTDKDFRQQRQAILDSFGSVAEGLMARSRRPVGGRGGRGNADYLGTEAQMGSPYFGMGEGMAGGNRPNLFTQSKMRFQTPRQVYGTNDPKLIRQFERQLGPKDRRMMRRRFGFNGSA